MLPPAFRLRRKRDFDFVFQKSRVSRANGLTIRARENGLDVSRFGIMVSKKVSKQATKRNRFRRLIREAVRKNLGFIRNGFDIVLIVSPDFRSFTQVQVEERLLKLMRQNLLLRGR
ncbi:MAG: ribonuclease P protein component [Candidatus Wildermuthbacteria bacterium]|nr:ribonuclease P protein component [Candidatus Wildermuthbacteria bacterium]